MIVDLPAHPHAPDRKGADNLSFPQIFAAMYTYCRRLGHAFGTGLFASPDSYSRGD